MRVAVAVFCFLRVPLSCDGDAVSDDSESESQFACSNERFMFALIIIHSAAR